MKMVQDLYRVTIHFLYTVIDPSESFYCDSLGWEKPSDLERNPRDLIYLLLNIKPSFIISECHVTHPSNRQSSTHKCIESRCVPFFPLQRCGNVCGVIVSILAVSISIEANLFFSFCKNKSIYPAH